MRTTPELVELSQSLQRQLELDQLVLPSLPENALQVRQLASDPRSTLKQIADAIAAASDGDTVTLLKDTSVGVAGTSNFWMNKSITLDLGGHTVTAAYQIALGVGDANAVVTVKNGTLKDGSIAQDIEVFDFSKSSYVSFLSDFLLPLKRSWAEFYVR